MSNVTLATTMLRLAGRRVVTAVRNKCGKSPPVTPGSGCGGQQPTKTTGVGPGCGGQQPTKTTGGGPGCGGGGAAVEKQETGGRCGGRAGAGSGSPQCGTTPEKAPANGTYCVIPKPPEVRKCDAPPVKSPSCGRVSAKDTGDDKK